MSRVAAHAGQVRLDVAREGGTPALVEDRLVQGLDVAIGLRPAGADVRAPDTKARERLAEPLALELLAVVTQHPLESPAGRAELARDAPGDCEVSVPVGLPCLQTTSSTQANEEATSIAVSCQTAPSAPRRRPT